MTKSLCTWKSLSFEELWIYLKQSHKDVSRHSCRSRKSTWLLGKMASLHRGDSACQLSCVQTYARIARLKVPKSWDLSPRSPQLWAVAVLGTLRFLGRVQTDAGSGDRRGVAEELA